MHFLPHALNKAEELSESLGPLSFQHQLAKEAKKAVCKIYKKNPYKFLKGPQDSFGQGMYQFLCGDENLPDNNLPPNPEPEIRGGKCNTLYRIEHTYTTPWGATFQQGGTNINNIQGPLKRIWVIAGGVDIGLGQDHTDSDNYWIRHCYLFAENEAGQTLLIQQYTNNGSWGVKVTGVTRLDGLPDNCGDFPEVFINTQNITNTDIEFDITINNTLNNLNLPLGVKVILPDLNNNKFAPIINIGGIDIQIDFSGYTFNYNPENKKPNSPDYPSLPSLLFNNNSINLDKIDNSINNLSGEINTTLENTNNLSGTLNNLSNTLNNNVIPTINNTNELINNLEFPEFPECHDYSNILEEINTKIDSLLEEEMQIDYLYGECNINENGTPFYQINSEEITVNKYLASGKFIESKLNLIEGKKECLGEEENISIAIPDWWQSKRMQSPPQLICTFKRADSRNYHSLSIPHPIMITKPNTTNPIIPEYQAGNYQGMIVLKDNSKFIVNCIDKEEAERIITLAIGLINPQMLDNPPDIAYTDRRGIKILQTTRIPKKVKYFPDGIKNLSPQWQYKIT